MRLRVRLQRVTRAVVISSILQNSGRLDMSESYSRDSAGKGALAVPQASPSVSPISTASWQQAFKNGSCTMPIAVSARVSTINYAYGTKKDYNALSNAIKSYDGKVGLIVTTGGNIAYRAAVDAGLIKTPFVSLVGEVPARHPDKFYRRRRAAELAGKRCQNKLYASEKAINASDIGLFCNRRSAMHGDETTLWHGSEYYLHRRRRQQQRPNGIY